MKVLMVASEVEPFAKTGGLGDVLGALPKSLRDKGVDVRVVMPKYNCIPEKYKKDMQFKKHFYVSLGWRNQYCGVLENVHNGITYYFLDNEYYFWGQNLYGERNDIERFTFFSKASLEMLQHIDFRPDIIHCHDWETAVVPVLYDFFYKKLPIYNNIKIVFTIHNLKYQGIDNKMRVNDLLGLPDYYFTNEKMEFYGDANYMKAGIVFSNFVTTVSPSYADEIRNPYFGERLDGLLRAKDGRVGGILNGIDYEIYSPVNDEFIYCKYSAEDFIQGKQKNKIALQQELGIEVNADIPIMAIVSRLESQKGLDLVENVMEDIMKRRMQLVVLGTGVHKYEEMFQIYAWNNHYKVSANIMFNNVLAHKIYAGSDMFLMPSLYEPCGLGQIISLAYGTVPIVREIGGLKDTVKAYNNMTRQGNGFNFWAYNAHEMLAAIDRALDLYYNDRDSWNHLVKTAMNCNFSWAESAQHYLNIYNYITSY